MEPVDTLICARWVLPVEPDGTVLDDHAVAMRAGRIVAVLPTADGTATYAAGRTRRAAAATRAAGPGQRAHARGDDAAARPGREPAARRRGCTDAIWPIERRWVDPEYVRDGTELAIAEMLRGGVTCFADMHLWPEIVARTAADAAHARSVGLVVVEAATRWAASANEYIEKGMALRDEYRGDPLIATAFRAARALRARRCDAGAGAPAGRRTRDPRGDCTCTSRPGKSPRARLATASVRSPASSTSGSPARCSSRCT